MGIGGATDLFTFAGDENAHDLGEEGCQEGVEGGLALQEGIHLVQQPALAGQLVCDLAHIRCQQLTSCVGVPDMRETEEEFSITLSMCVYFTGASYGLLAVRHVGKMYRHSHTELTKN